MFNHIMAPVDLNAVDKLSRALDATADAAKHYGAKVTYVSASNTVPTAVAHTPEEFKKKLAAFASDQADKHGIETDSHPLIMHDQRADLDHALVEAAKTLDADLIVMASHDPNFFDHFWASNGGAVARDSHASVMLVRGK
ncbi:universal stress protein [Roseivivax sediminis]|uniref:Nucleotide-binding universal stress protein, UspA family n=1 Tax=Roseivivax sediminis TaxID=936889 RepID=A0A1I2AZB0_9RHOB|nr:universal stress protein [Roseivivax sediminis]SFE49291.1 Nucleotide-binding universal stress protein, UspA family [Roseivivax sediminis]